MFVNAAGLDDVLNSGVLQDNDVVADSQSVLDFMGKVDDRLARCAQTGKETIKFWQCALHKGIGGSVHDDNVRIHREQLDNGHDADSVPHDENTGYHKVIDEYVDKGDIKIVYDQYIENWSPDGAMAAVENILTRENNDIQAIICNNDGMAGGAVQALIGQKLAGKVYVAGMDAELAACQRVAEGTQTVTVLTGYNPLADAVFDAALQLAKGEALTGADKTTEVKGAQIPTIEVEPVIITQDNLYEQIVKTGFRKIEDVYANVPKDQWPAES